MYQREWIGIMLTILAIGFVVYANLATSNKHEKKVEDKIEPISQPVDSIMDSIDWDCGE